MLPRPADEQESQSGRTHEQESQWGWTPDGQLLWAAGLASGRLSGRGAARGFLDAEVLTAEGDGEDDIEMTGCLVPLGMLNGGQRVESARVR